MALVKQIEEMHAELVPRGIESAEGAFDSNSLRRLAETPTSLPTVVLSSASSVLPTPTPTTTPTEPLMPISFPALPEAFVIGGALKVITIRFTQQYYQWLKLSKKVSFDFAYDAVVVDGDGKVWENLVTGGVSTTPQIKVEYTPDASLMPTGSNSALYFIRVVEYTYGFDRTSQPFRVTRSLTPTIRPSYAPSTSDESYAPTIGTLALSILLDSGDTANFGDSSQQQQVLVLGSSISMILTLTGTSARSGMVTVRLCEGNPELGPNLCSRNNGYVASITTLATVENDGNGAKSTSIDYIVPSDLVPGDGYYIALFSYHNGRRDGSDQVAEMSFTGPIRIVPFDPSATPSAAPSLYAPSVIPSPAPSYAPTACDIKFEELPLLWVVGERVTIRLTSCEYEDATYSFSYDYGIMDVLLYSSSRSREAIASYERLDSIASYEHLGTSNSLRLTYMPEANLAGLGWYRLRAIEYSRGFDVYSDSFRIESFAPSPRPSTSLVDCVVVEPSFGFGDVVLVGQSYWLSVRWGGERWPFAQAAVNVSVYLCHKYCHVDDAVVVCLASMTATGSVPQPATFGPLLRPSKDYKFVATIVNDDFGGHQDAASAFHSVCISDRFSIQHFEPTPRPTRPHPTTVSPSFRPLRPPTSVPSALPTAAPTSATIVFLEQPTRWVVGETYTIGLKINTDQAYSYDHGGVLDLLLYAAAPDVTPDIASYVAPTATIVVYAELDSDTVRYQYTVPPELAPGSSYQLRAIEYTRGLDVYSDLFSIVTFVPTISPTRAFSPSNAPYYVPSGPTLALLLESEPQITANGGALIPVNTTITLSLVATDDYTGPRTASVYVCGAHVRSGKCGEYLETVAFALSTGTVMEFTPSEQLVGHKGVFFEVDAIGDDFHFESPSFTVIGGVPSLRPTPHPSDRPTRQPSQAPTSHPTLAPSSARLDLSLSKSFADGEAIHWLVGSTQVLRVRLHGYGDATAYVDVYLYEASDASLTPLAVLANGAEAAEAELILEYVVPSELLGIPLIARAVDYTHGYDARSTTTLIVETSYAPSAVPSMEPTPSQPSYTPTVIPTFSPTVSTLSVTITTDAGTELSERVIANETSLDFRFAYTGSLAHNVNGYVTLRLCAAVLDDDSFLLPYNGPAAASPYESCETVSTLLRGAPLLENSLTLAAYVFPATLHSDGFYFRVDSMADRASLGNWPDRWSAFSLAFTSKRFDVDPPRRSST